VSPSTVSKALAGDVKVSAATRERVRAAAAAMGYQANPTASLLAKRRHAGRTAAGRLTVAFLGNGSYSDEAVFRDAGVDPVWVVLKKTDAPRKLLETLWNRGVSGLLLNVEGLPWRVPDLRALPWDRFAVVKLARVHPELSFHLVRHDPFDYMLMGLRQACANGAKKVCVLLLRSESEVDNLARMGALLAFMETECPTGVRVEWRYGQGLGQLIHAEDRDWLVAGKPDRVLLFHFYQLYELEALGLPKSFRPRFYAVLHSPSFPHLARPLSGCDISMREYYRRALGMLLELIGRGERGFVPFPTEQVIEPVWVGMQERPNQPE